MIMTLMAAGITGLWADEVTGTIVFGKNDVKITSSPATGQDDIKNTWAITTAGTTSYTPNAGYSQIGSSNNPATSITFTTTLADDVNITAFSAKFGGFNGTAGDVTLKIGDTTVGSGSLNATNDVTVNATLAATGKVLTVTVTNISKGVKAYNISYTYAEASNPELPTPVLSFENDSYEATIGTPFLAPELTNESNVDIIWSSSVPTVATVDSETGQVTLVGKGTTTIIASSEATDEYNASSASYTLTVTDPSVETSISIDGTGITNTNLYNGSAAGSFVAHVFAGEDEIEGAQVTWTSSDETVATIDAEAGAVTILAVGSTTITATYAGVVGQYKASSETFTLTVTNDDPTIKILWSEDFGDNFDANKDTYNYVLGNNSYVADGAADKYAGGAVPEILVSKGGGSFTATIPLERIQGVLTLTYKTNNSNLKITTTTDGVTLSGDTTPKGNKETSTVTFSGITTDFSEIVIVFTNSFSSNVRLDNIVLKGSQLPEGAVASPVISVPETFIGSTTAEITCATEGAAIKYSFDNENWSDYSEALTITATTTIYAKAVKDGDESSVVSKTTTKTLPRPTVTIDDNAIKNTNVFLGTEAGTLAASVTYNDATVEGATVTWSGDNDEVATISAETGNITLVAAGTVTFTATYAGNADYNEATSTYQLTVTNSDPNVPGTEDNPYTVAQAIEFINTLGSATSSEQVYVSGIISQVDKYNESYHSIQYWISDDGTTTGQMEVYSGKGIDGANFNSVDDLQVGDIVTVKGYVKMYNTTPEFDKNNELVSFERPVNTDPTITISPANVNAKAAETEGSLTITYANLTITDESDFEVQFYNGEGEELQEDPDWILVEVTANNDNYAVSYMINANAGEARTTYFKVYAMDDETNLIYSNLVTVTQAKYVVDYATVPFYFKGGKADITTGLTESGLGSDYNSSTNPNTQLKFDNTGDVLILKLNEQAGSLAFSIKGNSFSGGTFTLQTSVDGQTYSVLKNYTEFGNAESYEIFSNIAENVRYIKWIYTEKSTGNVGLGNISVCTMPYTRDGLTVDNWGTICLPYDADVAGAQLYSIAGKDKADSPSFISLDPVESAKAGTPYIFQATSETLTATYTSAAHTDAKSENGLIGTYEAIVPTEGNDPLKGMYLLSGGVVVKCGTGCSIAANRAYIDMSQVDVYTDNGENVKMLTVSGSTTGIRSMGDDQTENGVIYNLAGQRVEKATRGLYIVNGKKVLVK